MSIRITDRQAILSALYIAYDSELTLCEAYGNNKEEKAVKDATRRMAAFDRVAQRYYGRSITGLKSDDFKHVKTISVGKMLGIIQE